MSVEKVYKTLPTGKELLVNVKEGEKFLYPPSYVDAMIEKFSHIINSEEKLKNKTVIYMVGEHRRGKSVLAKKLRGRIQNSYILSLARPMKLVLESLFPKEFLVAKSPEVRRLYQSFGEAKRAVTLNYFLTVFVNTLKGDSDTYKYVIVDDVYHINERILMHLFPNTISVKFDVSDFSKYTMNASDPSYDTSRVSVKELLYLLQESDYDLKVSPTTKENFREVMEDTMEKIVDILGS